MPPEPARVCCVGWWWWAWVWGVLLLCWVRQHSFRAGGGGRWAACACSCLAAACMPTVLHGPSRPLLSRTPTAPLIYKHTHAYTMPPVPPPTSPPPTPAGRILMFLCRHPPSHPHPAGNICQGKHRVLFLLFKQSGRVTVRPPSKRQGFQARWRGGGSIGIPGVRTAAWLAGAHTAVLTRPAAA